MFSIQIQEFQNLFKKKNIFLSLVKTIWVADYTLVGDLYGSKRLEKK